MKWKKLGLVFSPDKSLWWQQHYSILPTPVHLKERNLIRVFFATTCAERFGRITFIDLDENDPTQIIYKHPTFILDTGIIGAFDDCGVNPSSILKIKSQWFLYFAGYQRHYRTPYSILSGLAMSNDGLNFTRFQKTPILERTNAELSLRSAPTVLLENGMFHMWYVADHGWKTINSEIFKNKQLPQYCLKYACSKDGINWDANKEPIFLPQKDEFGFGRPFIFKDDQRFLLFYSVRRENTSYRIGFAESIDLKDWVRKDDQIGIEVSQQGWDSEMICYPAVISVKGKVFLFYNGNNNGETGFGVAELIEE